MIDNKKVDEIDYGDDVPPQVFFERMARGTCPACNGKMLGDLCTKCGAQWEIGEPFKIGDFPEHN